MKMKKCISVHLLVINFGTAAHVPQNVNILLSQIAKILGLDTKCR